MNRQVAAWLVLVVGLVLTTLASLEVKQAIEQDATEDFAFTSDQVTLKIRERLDAYALTLKGGAGLFAASSTVDRREWQAYVEKLRTQDSLPGVQGIGFSQVIPPHQLAAHIAKVRAEGFPDYRVYPAGERALYTAIIYLEPFRGRNLRAFGFDMFSEPVRRAAMEQARDSGAPALSGKVELVQETGTEVQAGTLMYVPVYRNGAPIDTVEQRRAALIGWSYSPYRMQDLMEGILDNWADHKTKRVDVHIYTGSEVQADSLLYDSHPALSHTTDPRYYQQRTIDFNGQHWLLAFHTGEDVAPINYATAWATLAGGIVLSSLLCALMLALARTQARARDIAASLTEDLRRSEDSLRKSAAALRSFTRDFDAFLDQTSDFVYFKDADSRIRFCSKTLADITGHRHWREMVGKHDRELFPPDTAKIYEEEEAPVIAEGRPLLNKVDPYYDKDGRTGYVETNKWPLFDDDKTVVGIFGISRDITERNRAETALLEEKKFTEDTLNALPGVFYMFDATGRFVRWNHQFSKVTGYSDAELAIMQGSDFFTGDDQRRVGEAMQLVFSEGQADVEADFQTKDGQKLPYHFQGQRSSIGGQAYLLGVGIDITERKQAEAQLQLAASVFTHAREGITITDRDANILDVNAAFTDITGYSREEVLGKNPRILNSGKQDKAFYATMWHDLQTKDHWYGEVWNRHKDGGVFAEMLTISAVRDERGEIQNYIALFSDITMVKEHQAQLEYIAHYDALTGLPNRLLLGDRLRQAMSQAPRRGQSVAVAFLDLDGFKAVNDTHGHEVGDQLLATLAKRMTQALRDGDTLARLGGDEFVAVLVDLPDIEASVPVLTRLLEAAALPFHAGDIVLNVSASLGVTFYPQDEEADADQLLRQADQAMYQAKLAGKNRYHLFDAVHDEEVRGHHESLERIKHALGER